MATNPLHRPLTFDELSNLRAYYKMKMDGHQQNMQRNLAALNVKPALAVAKGYITNGPKGMIMPAIRQFGPKLKGYWAMIQSRFKK